MFRMGMASVGGGSAQYLRPKPAWPCLAMGVLLSKECFNIWFLHVRRVIYFEASTNRTIRHPRRKSQCDQRDLTIVAPRRAFTRRGQV